jgi:K+-transporting ATPase ATPase C chain
MTAAPGPDRPVPPARSPIAAPKPSRTPPPEGGAGAAAHLRAASLLLLLTILTAGVAYPVVVTAAAEILVPSYASGSLLTANNGTIVGSAFVAQDLSSNPGFFWSRPSPIDYNMTLGTPSFPSAADETLANETRAYMAIYGNGTVNATLPPDLVSSSGSGLDPDLTPAAVLVQIPRIALATHLTVAALDALVRDHIHHPFLGLLGPEYVNVLQLDLALLALEGR